MTNQLTELLTQYGPICELWLDQPGWRPAKQWRLREIYHLVKTLQPNCLMTVNWTVAYNCQPLETVVYWPSDFRTADPLDPCVPDPKQYLNPNLPGVSYYMPFESPKPMMGGPSLPTYWFWHSDGTYETAASLESWYGQDTAQNDVMLQDMCPDLTGQIPAAQSNLLYTVGQALAVPMAPARATLQITR